MNGAEKAPSEAVIGHGDIHDVCERGMQLLRERGLEWEVSDRKDPESIVEIFAIYDLPFDIRLCGTEWYEVIRHD